MALTNKYILSSIVYILGLVVLLSIPVYADSSTKAVIRNPDFSSGNYKGWHYQTKKPNDSKIDVINGTLRITRKNQGYFLRIYQDISISRNQAYTLQFRMKVQGDGYGHAWVYMMKGKKWIGRIFGPKVHASGWQTIKLHIPASDKATKLRIDFAPKGTNTTIWIDDIQLHPIANIPKSKYPIVPKLNGMRVRLDGKTIDHHDKGFWRYALQLGNFHILGQPKTTAQPQTQVRLAVHDGMLWIAYHMNEPNPAGIQAGVKKNVATVYINDSAQTFLSVNRKEFIQFTTNASGYSAVSSKGEAHKIVSIPRSWYSFNDKISQEYTLKANASRQGPGWTVEQCISISQLIKNKTIHTDKYGRLILYANFARNRPQGKQPFSCWVPMKGATFMDPSQFQPIVLQWKPSPSAKSASNISSSDNEKGASAITGKFTYQLKQPRHLIAGKPVYSQWNRTKTALPGQLKWNLEDGLDIPATAQKTIATGICASKGAGTWIIHCQLWKNGKLPDRFGKINAKYSKRLNSKEAFALTITSNGAQISARTYQGVMRGLATLTLLCDGAQSQGKKSIQTGLILDAPKMAIRGYMINVPMNQAKQAIRILFLLRYNTVMMNIAGYGKYAEFPFDSPAKLSKHQTTKAQWQQLASYIRALGMTPLPLVFTWNNGGYIVSKPQYKNLAVRPDLQQATRSKKDFRRNLSPYKKKSYNVVFDLLGQVIDTMKLKNIHVGIGEINNDDVVGPLAKKLGMTKADWLLRVVNRTNDYLHKRNVRMFMWGDMLNPYHNQGFFSMPAKQMWPKLPKNMVVDYWNYGRGPYPGLKKIDDAGFHTVVSTWYRISNVSELLSAANQLGSLGVLGMSFGTTSPKHIAEELATSISLAAYLSWSPQYADHLDQLPWVPAWLYQTAAYRHGIRWPSSAHSRTVTQPSGDLVYGTALTKALGLPEQVMPVALAHPTSGPLGSQFQPWIKSGKPAAIVVHGGESDQYTIPLHGTTNAISILNVTGRMMMNSKMHDKQRMYRNTLAVKYILEYADGSTETIPAKYRRQISAWNDRYLAAQAWPVLFGTVDNKYLLNIPALLWINPHPNKKLKALHIESGNHKGMDTAILGITLIK